MQLICAFLFLADIVAILALYTSESSSELFPFTRTGSWINGEFYDESDENPHIDERIRTVHLLKRNQPCITSSGLNGKCRKRRYCNTLGRTFQIPKNSDYCLLHGLIVGICCPDEYSIVESTVATTSTYGHASSSNQTLFDKKPMNGQEGLTAGCGVAPPMEGRIYGGAVIPVEGRWPWVAAIMKDGGETHFCGGTLITKRHILSAAHCFHRTKAKEISVRLGEFHLDEPSDIEVSIPVIEIIKYFDYNHISYENDIAILVLSRPVEFVYQAIWPACLPAASPNDEEIEENDPLINKTVIVTGWGSLFYGGPTSAVLMEVDIHVWKQNDCRDAYVQPILPTVLCAGESSGGKDSCQGDSGGPLVLMDDNGKWSVIGVVSWGIRCGDPGKPGVYTRVGKYIDWILDITS